MYVHVRVHVHVYMYVYVYGHVYVYEHLYVYTRVYVYVHVYVCVYVYVKKYEPDTFRVYLASFLYTQYQTLSQVISSHIVNSTNRSPGKFHPDSDI